MKTAYLILSILFVTAVGGTTENAAAVVVLNELMPDPASDWSPSDGDEEYHSLEDEWVEIFNTGPGAVDVTGWRLRDAVSDSSWRFAFDGVLEPGCFFVVYGNESYQWEDSNGFSKNGLSLNNSGDTVTLVMSDLVTVIDQISYDTQDAGDDRSYGRVPDGSEDWVCNDGLNPANPPGSGIPPTPGMPNTGAPVEALDWSRIKVLFLP
ncbi:MAG: lamin tail domain-containing protein [Candidatus Eisenbacteria bacterium]|nr:lamin tail domain-containing protein [Candidatus Eisenbacteria bacterium]